MTETVSLRWQPEYLDVVDMFRFRARSRSLWVLVLAGLAASAVAEVIDIRDRDWFGVAVIAAAAAFLVALLLFASRVSALVTWRRLDAVRHQMEVEVSSAGLAASTEIASSTIPWSSVRVVRETDRIFAVEIAGHRSGMHLALAKRGLPESDLPVLRALLTEHAPAPA